MLFGVLQARAPAAAQEASSHAEHIKTVALIGELALMSRNLFLDPPKWRVPFCATARSFILQKRDYINREETTLFRVALDHLTQEDWTAIDHAARAANAPWNDDPTSTQAAEALGLKLAREARASGAVRRP